MTDVTSTGQHDHAPEASAGRAVPTEPEAQTGIGEATEPVVPVVLFLCVHNAGRSQMAAAWAEHIGGSRVAVLSGGSDPAAEVNAAAVNAMAEAGIDMSTRFPKLWTNEMVRAVDVVVTMGCGDACPVYPGKRYEDWQIDDPSGRDLAAVRVIRDEIAQRARDLLSSLDVLPTS